MVRNSTFIKQPLKFIRAVIICHGKSEVIFAQNLRSNLRLKIEIDSKNNGESSIQIKSLLNFLTKKGYKNIKSILKKFPYIKHKKQELFDFKIFIIMDTDEPELTFEDIEKYKNKTMFKNFDYYNYIVPIYNDKNLDDVLIRLGYKIDIKRKSISYAKIFPGNNGDYEAFKQLKEKIKTSKNSNLIELLMYLEKCIE